MEGGICKICNVEICWGGATGGALRKLQIGHAGRRRRPDPVDGDAALERVSADVQILQVGQLGPLVGQVPRELVVLQGQRAQVLQDTELGRYESVQRVPAHVQLLQGGQRPPDGLVQGELAGEPRVG